MLCHQLRAQRSAGFRWAYGLGHDFAQSRKSIYHSIAEVVLGLVQFVQSSRDVMRAAGFDLTQQPYAIDIHEQTSDRPHRSMTECVFGPDLLHCEGVSREYFFVCIRLLHVSQRLIHC